MPMPAPADAQSQKACSECRARETRSREKRLYTIFNPLQLGESQHVDLEGGLQQLFGDALVGAVLATDSIGVLDPGHVHAERRALLELAGVGAADEVKGLCSVSPVTN